MSNLIHQNSILQNNICQHDIPLAFMKFSSIYFYHFLFQYLFHIFKK